MVGRVDLTSDLDALLELVKHAMLDRQLRKLIVYRSDEIKDIEQVTSASASRRGKSRKGSNRKRRLTSSQALH
jgi:hypothetical protein